MIDQLYKRHNRVQGGVVRACMYDIIYHYQILASFWILQLLGSSCSSSVSVFGGNNLLASSSLLIFRFLAYDLLKISLFHIYVKQYKTAPRQSRLHTNGVTSGSYFKMTVSNWSWIDTRLNGYWFEWFHGLCSHITHRTLPALLRHS